MQRELVRPFKREFFLVARRKVQHTGEVGKITLINVLLGVERNMVSNIVDTLPDCAD